MKRFFILVLLAFGWFPSVQSQGIRINEVRGVADMGHDRNGSWIELFNTGPDRELLGMRVVVNGDRHMIDAPLTIPQHGFLVLWCDGETELGPLHLRCGALPDGSQIELLGIDGRTVIDSFMYRSSASMASVGIDDRGERSSFEQATPGKPNSRKPIERADKPRELAPVPEPTRSSGIYAAPFTVDLYARHNAEIRYTMDGTSPSASSTEWRHSLRIAKNTVLRAAAISKSGQLGEELIATYIIDGRSERAIHITATPKDLWSDSTGIYSEGLFTNYSRTGKAWERPAVLQFLSNSPRNKPERSTTSVGIRIAGSGSRGLAKRSFKLHLRDDDPTVEFTFPQSIKSSEGMLRADASPNGYLRNTLMEAIVLQGDLHVTVQRSTTLPVYINGMYWGLYRWMPSKDEEWLRALTGCDRVDVLEGPALQERSGSRADLLYALDLMKQQAPVELIDTLIDTESLIDLACMDVFTGRADHDLNVRCYRPWINGTPGRWKWILFDMDLWSGPNENSVQRMCTSSELEAPYLPLILAHPQLRGRYLRRMAALQATILSRASLRALVDSIGAENATDLAADHDRWRTELDRPDPETALEQFHDLIARRGERVMQFLSSWTGQELETITLDVPEWTDGDLTIDGSRMQPGRRTITLFKGLPLEVIAHPATGKEFAGWGRDHEDMIYVLKGSGRTLHARFQPLVGSSRNGLEQRLEQ